MQRKIKIIVATILFFVVFGLIFSFIDSFWGNPVSASIATNKIKSYVKVTYPDVDLEISKALYNFKEKSYHSKIQSKSSIDTHFTVEWSKGKIIDSYEYDVLKHYSTCERLTMEFSNNVEEIINNEFPYETSIMFADFGKAEVDLNNLTLDMPLDMQNSPLPAYLVIYILNKDVSYEFLSARLIELFHLMEDHHIQMDYYSVVIETPMPEEEKGAPGGESLYLFEYPSDKIMEEDLITEIKEHQQAYEDEHEKY